MDLQALSEGTMMKLYEYVALDYYVFNFIPPHSCQTLQFWTEYQDTFGSKLANIYQCQAQLYNP